MNYTVEIPQDFNITNQINFLKQVSGIQSTNEILAESVDLTRHCLKALKDRNLPTRVVYNPASDCTACTTAFSPQDTLLRISAQPVDAKKTTGQIPVPAWFKEAVEFIKQQTGVKSDAEAIGFALRFNYELAEFINRCPGKAFVACIKDLDSDGLKMVTPFEKTVTEKFKRAGRKMKRAAAKALPKKAVPGPRHS